MPFLDQNGPVCPRAFGPRRDLKNSEHLKLLIVNFSLSQILRQIDLLNLKLPKTVNFIILEDTNLISRGFR